MHSSAQARRLDLAARDHLASGRVGDYPTPERAAGPSAEREVDVDGLVERGGDAIAHQPLLECDPYASRIRRRSAECGSWAVTARRCRPYVGLLEVRRIGVGLCSGLRSGFLAAGGGHCL